MGATLPRILQAVAALLLAVFLAAVLADPLAFRRDLALLMKTRAVGDGVHVARATVPERAAEWADLGAEARRRAEAWWGSPRAAPRVIFAGDAETKRAFATGNPFAEVVFHRGDTWVIVGPRGEDADVVAHAWMHAEIRKRLGPEAHARLPAWFDEGLATQVDRRAFLAPAALAGLRARGEALPPEALMRHEDFLGADHERALASARLAVDEWLQRHGRAAAARVLDAMASGAGAEAIQRPSSSATSE